MFVEIIVKVAIWTWCIYIHLNHRRFSTFVEVKAVYLLVNILPVSIVFKISLYFTRLETLCPYKWGYFSKVAVGKLSNSWCFLLVWNKLFHFKSLCLVVPGEGKFRQYFRAFCAVPIPLAFVIPGFVVRIFGNLHYYFFWILCWVITFKARLISGFVNS